MAMSSSSPNINAVPAAANEGAAKARKKDAPPLVLEDTLRDLAILRASGVDLAAVLASTTASAVPVSTTTATASDTSVVRSYEFARAARAAIGISNRGDVEAQVERVNDVREKLEDVAAGLEDG
ncbi:hypothetical protein EDB83DRAFT_911671 [Lactarius deliciosus]|nr:hypothetical protein EDB83DRAFT_911671 [Lactarius deliciosus]